MAIARKPKMITKTVRVMTDPDPSFVSLVGHGANQTPWLVVKSNKIVSDINKEETDMSIAKKTIKSVQKAMKDAGQTETHGVVKLAFDKSAFADEAAVTAWLQDGGYQDFAIKATDTGFEVTSMDATQEVETREIPTDTGVTFHIATKADIAKATEAAPAKKEDEAEGGDDKEGEPEKDAEPAASDEDEKANEDEKGDENPETVSEDKGDEEGEAEKSAKDAQDAQAEFAKKVDFFAALFSDKTSLAGVLQDAEDGVPMGAVELMTAFQTTLINATKDNNVDAVKQACKDFQRVYLALWSAVDKATMPDPNANGQGNVQASAKEAGTDQTTQAITIGDVEGVVAKAMSDFEGKVSEMLTSAVEKFTSKADEVSGVANEAKEMAEKANTTTSQLEQTIQTRKSEDTHVVKSDTTQVSKDDEAFQRRLTRVTLGL